jgi:phosphatidate cytidylyltransferase
MAEAKDYRRGEDIAGPLDEVSPGAPPGRSLPVAVATGLILVGVIALSSWLGPGAFFVVVCIVVLIAAFELLDALVQHGRRPSIVLGLTSTFAMLLVVWLGRPGLIAAVLAGTLLTASLLALRPRRGPAPASDVAWTAFAALWIGGGGAGATGILLLPGGLALLVAFVLTTALDDIGAYFSGTSFGRHKIAPSISPAKSWEGFGGGLVAALLGGLAAGSLLNDLGVIHGLAMGALCGALAPVGDLLESLVKRELGIKDSGRLLPGHGGFLDRLDAIIFCAPFVFMYLAFVAR